MQGGPRHAAAMIFPVRRLYLKFYLLDAFGGTELFVCLFFQFEHINFWGRAYYIKTKY